MKRVGLVYRETFVKDVKKHIDDNNGVFLFSYTKLSSPQISELRKDLRKAGADVFVSKNALARIALIEAEQEPLAEKVAGQTAFVWTSADSAAVAKILVKFATDRKTVSVKGGILDKRLLTEGDVQRLSELPSREVLLSQLLGTIQAPLTRFAGALNAKSRDLLSILKQLGEKKGGNQ